MTDSYDLPAVKLQRGCRLLDQHHPGWAAELDLDRLEMWSQQQCVLGQLYGSYWAGWAPLGIPADEGGRDYGFCLPTEDWLPAILERRRTSPSEGGPL